MPPISRSVSTLLLLFTPLNSANSVPESVNPGMAWLTSPPPFNNVSSRAYRAVGFFCTPTASTPLRRPEQRLEWVPRQRMQSIYDHLFTAVGNAHEDAPAPLPPLHQPPMTRVECGRGHEWDTRGREFVFVGVPRRWGGMPNPAQPSTVHSLGLAQRNTQYDAIAGFKEYSGASEQPESRPEGGRGERTIVTRRAPRGSARHGPSFF
ncbi:hypothetical protein D9611_008335 [Ephemerocybe angulata]|uniref:Uncharacterized protein n=1 Tax=Ephemerocybe angulata TaxID=980116 RepID=A0A8H5BIC5_9AGAR|nr:hypothetical protein D9611_008335 [Tulosesus angulatus]